ncbi:mRNA capping enzyme, large subunit family protein [Trichomonas vaginalis G3]|uniref:mRNA cap guanine-N(7) methyltransferase n=1 Tax=Trichomonas vaginalis (strain ATCC PRA-98 / G3) TaxID=412133 RepID=A2E7Y7_TRIV3|nr:mRNA (guanine-N7-)-methyltransferase protein [Trichomonas vaginalis G3]EAY11213.1 mRNA capping enzyme, large subunit family protein [Trichomonas vaginalis G3]KAI5551407.1 mRNA (guanine-N7-)-methyltransferase protein [Trichomonas vaginalis G3]|eukprot:XP_001323436.1 mRNA capping enzyme, large subunit family protein [Trichomonas vaginalis G3]
MSIKDFIVNTVADGYNLTKTTSLKERAESSTFHLREFNNWVKSWLILKYCPQQNANILDLACGKGGDIPKYKLKNPAFIAFADISDESVKECYRKYKPLSDKIKAQFIIGDSFNCNLKSLLPKITFHYSSCQFALHYAFKSQEMAEKAVANLTDQLLPGRYISITTVNACRLVRLFRERYDRYPPGDETSDTISNDLYLAKRNFDLKNIPPFGAGYIFYLKNAVNSIEEYLVHPKVLIDLFKAKNCELVYNKGFQEFYYEACNSNPEAKDLYIKLLTKKTKDFSGAAMTYSEWDIIWLYSIFVFVKSGDPTEIPKNVKRYPKVSNEMSYLDAETGESKTVIVPDNPI